MSVCRICLTDDVGLQNISELKLISSGRNLVCAEMFHYCFNIKITENFREKLCSQCWNQLKAFYLFKLRAIGSDTHLNSIKRDASEDADVKYELKMETLWEEVHNFSDSENEGKVLKSIKMESNGGLRVKEDDSEGDDQLLSVLKENNLNEVKLDAVPTGKRKKVKPKVDFKETRKMQMCDHCGKSVRNLKIHLLRHAPAAARRRVPCKLCNKTFANYSGRYRHYQIKHLGVKKFCELCNKFVVELRQHRLIMHNTSELPLQCHVCERRFISQSVLTEHMTMHSKLRAYECDQCHAKFRLKLTLVHHKRSVHEGERSHLCQYCSRGFFKKSQLQNHIRSHTKEKPFKCKECEKCFRTTSQRNNHQLIHTGVKVYSCDQCEMSFYNRGALRTHMVSHTKEKKHACKYCGVMFGRSDHRNRHQRSAHEKNSTV